jgi:hypothetical protein
MEEHIVGVRVDETVGEEVGQMLSFVGNKWADSTLDGYGREWAKFEEYCGGKGFVCLPAEPWVVALYLTWRFMQGGESVSGIACAAITAVHEAKCLVTPSTAKVVVWTKAGIEKARRRRPKVLPITVEVIEAWMRAKADMELEVWIRGLAIVCLGVRCIQRPAEVAGLNVEDVTFDKGVCWVLFKSSKTDQCGIGHTVPIEDGGDRVNVFRCLMDYVRWRRGIPGEPLFRVLRKDTRLGPTGVSSVVTKVGLLAGVKLSGRSLRVGGAVMAAVGGVPEAVTRKVANWRSDTVFDYYRSEETKGMGLTGMMFDGNKRRRRGCRGATPNRVESVDRRRVRARRSARLGL